MVNTRVTNPTRRRINRQLDRQKKARRRQSEKLLTSPDDVQATASIRKHGENIKELKMKRDGLAHSIPTTNTGRFRVLRVLDGITYWVIEDPKEIAELINYHIRREWESDIAEQEDHEEGKWLQSLNERNWTLVEAEPRGIKLSDEIMNYVNPRTGYNFRKRLEERRRILERDVDKFGAVIRPVVIRAEDNQLMDGYCRYHVLLDRNVKKLYAYVGRL